MGIPGWLTIAEYAHAAGVDVSAVRKSIRRGELVEAVKVAGVWLVPPGAERTTRPVGRPRKAAK